MIRRDRCAIIAGALLAMLLLQGCVAAVVPIAATGLLGGEKLGIGKHRQAKQDAGAEMAQATPPAAATPAPVSTPAPATQLAANGGAEVANAAPARSEAAAQPAPEPPATPAASTAVAQAKPTLVNPASVAELPSFAVPHPPAKPAATAPEANATKSAPGFIGPVLQPGDRAGAANALASVDAAPAAPATSVPPPADNAAARKAAAKLGFTIASRMPAPDTATTASSPGGSEPQGYRAFYDFVLEKLTAPASAGERHSMLLTDPTSLQPNLEPCGDKPAAVLLDLDPGRGLMPLAGVEQAQPGLARQLANLRQRGVTIYWISGHGPEAAGAIHSVLVQSGLDPNGQDKLIVSRFAGESKQSRRHALGQSNCLLAIVGDRRGDFDDLFDYVLKPDLAAPLDPLIGHGWFLAPTPLK